jgi:autonomous glycyl radical cofactor GrcA
LSNINKKSMDNSIKTNTIDLLTAREKKMYNFLLGLKHELEISGNCMTFETMRNFAFSCGLDEIEIRAVNMSWVTKRDNATCSWNDRNPPIKNLVIRVLDELQKIKKIERAKNKINKKERESIPANLRPVSELTKNTVSKEKNNKCEIRDKTIKNYLDFMNILSENQEMPTKEFYILLGKMGISKELRMALIEMGLIISLDAKIVWDYSIVPSRGLSICVGRHINARINKRGLPAFDIEHYRNAPLDEIVETTNIIKAEQTETVVVVEKTEISKPQVTVVEKTADVKPQEQVVEKKEVVKPQATIEAGDTASINMTMVRKLLAIGGEENKKLANKLLDEELSAIEK